jgi:hypothetical protein
MSQTVDVIELLHRLGIEEKTIARELDLPLVNVRAVLTMRRVSSYLQPEDKELADAMRDLAWRAYKEAKVIIEYGSPGERLGLIKTILSRTSAMVGQETTTRYDEMRNEFDEMLAGFFTAYDDTDDYPNEIEAGSASIETMDSDERRDD